MDGQVGISDNYAFEVDGIPFVTGFRPDPDVLTLVKHEAMLEKYRSVLAEHDHPRIVEIGLAYGASTAWLDLVADPEVLVGIELSTTPLELLDAYIRDRHRQDHVQVHLGVDQSDRATLRRIVDDAFGGEPIDLVIDDASHLFGPTLASFEVLFPRLRPGGTYIIEDWKGQDEIAHAMRLMLQDPTHPDHGKVLAIVDDDGRFPIPDDDPCSRLALELCLARTESTEVVESVTVDDHWIVVERGPAPIDPTEFRLDDLVANHFGMLIDRRGPAAPPSD